MAKEVKAWEVNYEVFMLTPKNISISLGFLQLFLTLTHSNINCKIVRKDSEIWYTNGIQKMCWNWLISGHSMMTVNVCPLLQRLVQKFMA
jgi:hypothetical protein